MAMEDELGTLDVEMSKDESSRTMTYGKETSSNARMFGSSTASATGNENQYEGGRDRSSNHNPNEEDECDENGEEKQNIGSLLNGGGRGANDRRVSYFYDRE